MTTTTSEREDYRGAVCLNRACTDLRGARGGDAPELPARMQLLWSVILHHAHHQISDNI